MAYRPEYQSRPDIRARRKAAQNRPEVKAKRSLWAKAYHARPEIVVRRAETAALEKNLARRRARWHEVKNLPGVREAKRAQAIEYYSRPDVRLQRLAVSAIRRARMRGLPFDVGLGAHLVGRAGRTFCVLCGCTLEFQAGRGKCDRAPSLDRRHPDRGYTIANVEIMCFGCNRAKNAITLERLVVVGRYMGLLIPDSVVEAARHR